METLGVIMARAGSAGLPNKHLLKLLDREVIDYTFEHAMAAKSLSLTVVSTDCRRILRRADRHFVTIRRPPSLATADASVQDVLLHALNKIEITSNLRPEAIVVLYGNVPVRPAGIIDRAVAMLEETGCDSVRSFCPVGKWHPAWMSCLRDGRVIPLQPGSIHRRQDLQPLWLHDGAVVAVSRRALERAGAHRDDPHAFFGTDRRGIETEMGRTIEIDHLRDLYWAEAVLREQRDIELRAA